MQPYEMDHAYPVLGSHSLRSMSSFSSLGSGSPCQRFLSPSPSPSPSPTRSTRRRGRAPSVPSADYAYADCPFDASQYKRRSRHSGHDVRRSQLVSPDVIDRLDTAAQFSYHHEGPYDAVYPERNRISIYSPLDALRESNEEALKATPHHMIADAIGRRRPLDGVAYYPPGHTDREGQTYDYAEGPNLMAECSLLPRQRLTEEDFRNDAFTNAPVKPFAPIRNVFRRTSRKHMATA